MDALDFLLVRYREVHGPSLLDGLFDGLSDAQARGRPHPGVNTIPWLLWHAARVEDVGVNRFVADRPQRLDDWLGRLGVSRLDVGTGMTDAEVDELSATIDLAALRGYWTAVAEGTLGVVESLRGRDLESPIPEDRVRSVCAAEGVVDARAAWLVDFWAKGRSRAWLLVQVALLHPYAHYFDARVTRGLWGFPSP
jgi:hypothetical protein